MAAVTICSDFVAQENKGLSLFPWIDGTEYHDLNFFNVEF